MFLCGKLGIENHYLTAENKSLEDKLNSENEKTACIPTPKVKSVLTEVGQDITWDVNTSKKTEDTTVTPVQTTTNLDENSDTEVDDTQTVTPEAEENPTDESNVDDNVSSPEEESQVPNVPVVDTPQDNGGGVKPNPPDTVVDNNDITPKPDPNDSYDDPDMASVIVKFKI